MATPTLTLHQGPREATFEEHPTEAARKALLAAAEIESEGWPELFRRVAAALPERAPVRKAVV